MLELNKVYCMDCLEGIKQVQDRSVDCIWTDPPYNINYGYENYSDNKGAPEYTELLYNVAKESYRVLKEGKVLFIKQSIKNMPETLRIFMEFFKFHNQIIWKNSSPAQPKDNYKPAYEVILMFIKGEKIDYFNDKFEVRKTIMPWNKKRTENYYGKLNNIWDDISYIYGGSIRHPEGIYKDGTNDKVHPCQHPIQLVIRCIGFVTKEDELVLDLFMGSGTVAVASKQIQRNFIGFELDPLYVKLCEKRLSQSTLI